MSLDGILMLTEFHCVTRPMGLFMVAQQPPSQPVHGSKGSRPLKSGDDNLRTNFFTVLMATRESKDSLNFNQSRHRFDILNFCILSAPC